MPAELISKDIVDLQDIEKVQFLQTLQADPAKYATYVKAKSDRILDEVLDTKRASFAKVSGDMARMMDMDHNSQMTAGNIVGMAATQDHILSEQRRLEGSTRYNLDLTRRQVEINNWYYENKRETLFVLQLALLVLLTVTVVLTVGGMGWLTEDFTNYLIAFVLVAGAGVWLYRWYYTTYIRDPRYWSRRTFKQDGARAPAGQICIGEGDAEVPPAPARAGSSSGAKPLLR
jgi:hypothetical protein